MRKTTHLTNRQQAPFSNTLGHTKFIMEAITQSNVEDAAELKFGPEFEDIDILSNAQVAVILQVSARSAVNRDEELHEVYRKTQKYVDRYNTMTNQEKNNQELVKELDNLQE